MDPRELKTGEPFSGLFPIEPATRAAIERSMRDKGFDPSKAIDVWRKTGLVLDGHTRLASALAVGVADVPVFFHDFETEDEALKYAIANQRDRRNITGADIARCVLAVDSRKTRGGDHSTEHGKAIASVEAIGRKSAEQTAKIAGTSRATVERVRSIADHAKEDPTILTDVLQGKETIRMAARKVADKKEKKGRKPPKVRQPFVPPAKPLAPKRETPSNLQHSPEDEAWLGSLPLRAKVVADRFDEDALVYRRFALFLTQIKAGMHAITGERSAVGMSLLCRALHQISDVGPIETWEMCPKCNGCGTHKGMCPVCRGGGYIIPGL